MSKWKGPIFALKVISANWPMPMLYKTAKEAQHGRSHHSYYRPDQLEITEIRWRTVKKNPAQ